MNFIRPQDRLLIAGLAVALIVVFARQELILIDRAREVERTSGLGLIPALLILIVVFLFHQQGKRQEAKAQAAAAQAGAAAAEGRAEEMERLGTFGQAPGRVLGIALRNAQLFQELREHSLRDGLTQCFNRTHALEVLDVELRRARRSQMPLTLIMFDLDHFKEVNDRYGHLCGDAVLAAVGIRMRDVLRGSDLKCRYGGEEFLVLLPETPLEGAKRVADTLRRELADLPIHWKDETLSITASFGVSMALPSEIDVEA